MSCFAPPSYVSVGTGPASSDLSAPSNVNGLRKSPTSSAVCKPERPKLSEEEKKNLMKNFFAKAETLSKPSNLNSKKSLGKQGKKLITKGSGKKKSTSNSASKTKDKDVTLKVDTSIKSSVKPEVKNHWAQDIVTKSLTPEISRKEYQNSQIQSFLRAKVVQGGSSTESEKSKSVSKRSFRQKSDQKSETKSKKKIEKTQSLESTLSTPSSPAKPKYDKPSSKSSPTAVFKLDRSIFSKFMTENTSNLTDDRKSSLSSQQGKSKNSSVQRNSGSEELAKAFDAIYSSTAKHEKLEKVGPKKSTLILQPVRNTSLTIENRSQDEIKVSEHPHKIMYSKSLSHVPLKSKCPPDLFPKSPKPVSVPSVKSVTSLISELNKKASSLAVPNPKLSPSPERAEHVLKASLQLQPQNPPPTSNEHFAPPPRRAKVKVSVTEAEPTLLQKITPSTRKTGEKTKNECILM